MLATLKSLNAPNLRTREALSHYRHCVRTIYTLRTRAGEARPTDVPYYLAIRFTIESGSDRLIERFGTEHLPIV